VPLNDKQISHLARSIDDSMDLPRLIQLADEIDVRLDSIAPNGSVQTRAEVLLKTVNADRPPRDRDLLESIVRNGHVTAALRTLANQLLKPTYQPPSDMHDAILLGRIGFFGRGGLRRGLREFTNPSHFTSHVLIVQGAETGGRTYSWEYLRHLASQAGSVPRQLRLTGATYAPRNLMFAVGQLLRLDLAQFPPLADEPQEMRMSALLNWFQGQLAGLEREYWLVIDDINEAEVTPEVRACAYAIALIVERVKPDKLWIALLGYNDVITDPEMRHCIRDQAVFPTVDMLARNFVSLAAASPLPLQAAKATEYASLLFSKHAKLDRAAMEDLTQSAEGLGQKLLLGMQP
jgi:hypothetical protein